jgi:hypothetical protein
VSHARRIFPLALSLLLLLLVAASAECAGQRGLLIYCGHDAGKSYIPSFYVNPSLYGFDSTPVTTDISFCSNRSATAKVVLLAPRGVRFDLSAAPGHAIGRVSGKAQVGKRTLDLPRRLGTIVAADPARYTRNSCAAGLHGAVWLLRTSTDDGKLRIAVPVYVDATSGDSAGRLQLCFSTTKRRITGWPATAVFRLLTLSVDSSVVSERPAEPAAYVWHGFFTPFRTNGWPNSAATVESRATQLLPIVWTLNGTYDAPSGLARLTGRLTQGDQPVAGMKFVLWHGTALGGTFPGIVNPTTDYPTTDAAGQFSATVPIAQTTFFRASGGTVLQYSRCSGPSTAPKGCVSASTSGFAGASAIVEVTVP